MRHSMPQEAAKADSPYSNVGWTLAALAYHRMARNLTARFGKALTAGKTLEAPTTLSNN